jgi:hypothetical protein
MSTRDEIAAERAAMDAVEAQADEHRRAQLVGAMARERRMRLAADMWDRVDTRVAERRFNA